MSKILALFFCECFCACSKISVGFVPLLAMLNWVTSLALRGKISHEASGWGLPHQEDLLPKPITCWLWLAEEVLLSRVFLCVPGSRRDLFPRNWGDAPPLFPFTPCDGERLL